MNVLADADLPGIKSAFPRPFKLTLYHSTDEAMQLVKKNDFLVCRSTFKVDYERLANSSLKYIATASSGTDHIDCKKLSSYGIELIDAKGCNARSVADYLISCLAYLSKRKLIRGKRAGIIGFGKVGTLVSQRLKALGFQLSIYDPLKTRHCPSFVSCSLDTLYDCDLLCIHAEYHQNFEHPSANLINKDFLKNLKAGCVILNAARGGIVNEQDLLLEGERFIYCTDVYINEPQPNADLIRYAELCTPHIAGHSLEGKNQAVRLVSEKIHKLLNFSLPVYIQPAISSGFYEEKLTWEDTVLQIYDPKKDTDFLKINIDDPQSFINLRKKHQYRHDFNRLPWSGLSYRTQLILGI